MKLELFILSIPVSFVSAASVRRMLWFCGIQRIMHFQQSFPILKRLDDVLLSLSNPVAAFFARLDLDCNQIIKSNLLNAPCEGYRIPSRVLSLRLTWVTSASGGSVSVST